ncbi:hypothetical protein CAS74_003902 [Pichia kudriavzevii]|uniref:DNA replication complex GINS protein SLD5 n=1 Tax=Pichia kudriavzevii TaxID=4909 RepID=A0A099P5E3_PICKU|nr:uncharacterized protein C5L36_0B09310 [Pichia kudriavzevii]AWU75689.1 hypothetical protein C5L36_0B09310 [Pichia kudriavzevii]KGK39407.1 hypothetical protein JL09_g1443 [Pichia kudriavzevii]ONH77346.1 DNA replication complex GINS protein SLD5 [Pichia kudriavzevii]OUT20906.1 hypothetical protein CAS74_003902 [Pichia kudriavzevii]
MNTTDIINDFTTEARNDFVNRYNEQAEDLLLLEQAWVREKTVPQLLPHESELVERIMERIRVQLETIDEMASDENTDKLTLVIIESELERIQYLLRAYTRGRLRKIDSNQVMDLSLLSVDEQTYLRGHSAMKNQFLTSLLGEEPSIPESDPDNESCHIFVRAQAPFPFRDEDTMQVGDVRVAKWKDVAHGVAEGALHVI